MKRRDEFYHHQRFMEPPTCQIVGTAAALIGGALIGAVGTMVAGSSAAGATADAAASAAQVQREGLAQQKELAAPYTALGQSAIPTLQNLLGIGKPGGPSPQQTLENMPGYKFAQSAGVDEAKAGGASMGMALSGNTLQGITDRATGIADQTYGSEIDRLMGVAGLGQAAAAGSAANIGHVSDNLSNIAIGQGNNLASIYANEGASIASAFGNAAGSYALMNTLKNINPTPATT